MPLKFYAPEWGNALPFSTFCNNVKSAGYDGVEMALPFDPAERQVIVDTLNDYDLGLVGQYWQSVETDLGQHARNYEKYLRHLAAAQPVFINCQTGKDFFTPDQNKRLFTLAALVSAETGVQIIHETHRGKALFAAHICQHYLTELPDLRITLDISHWCAVHESLLADQPSAVNMALSRTDHLHCRVGHPEGPQVSDPRAPEWESTLDAHLTWWDTVVATHRASGTQLTITTEFGPAPYMPTQPYTQLPLANQWEVNVFMLNLLRKRYT